MIHPHIPRQTDLAVRLSHNGFTATLSNDDQTVTIALSTGRVERTLDNIFLHIASGIPLPRIASHFSEHTNAESSCPCCKLEGRILSGSGRRKVSETDRLIASRAHTGGRVEIRHIRPGLSGAQLRAYEAAYNTRTTPHPTNIVKSVNKRIEDLI
jgi:hypothetical protein